MMNDEARRKIGDWMSRKCPNAKCPACGGRKWTWAQVARGQEDDGTDDVVLVHLYCDNCQCAPSFFVTSIGTTP